MSLVNGDLFDDHEDEDESGWVGDEPWLGSAPLDEAALDEEWCAGSTPRWVDEVVGLFLGEA